MTAFAYPPDSIPESLAQQARLLAERSRFRKPVYTDFVNSLHTFDLFEKLPFTNEIDIINCGQDMLCVSPREIKRIVTLKTSGTTGAPKRLYFTQGDLNRTTTFFSEGMRLMCGPGDTVAILMPGSTENGISDLLSKGLTQIGASPQVHGIITDMEAAASILRTTAPHTIVGIPCQIRALALYAPELRPANVLLSSDYVPQSVRDTVSRLWKCRVFSHYGLTESGYGCAVECSEGIGLHIRQDELYIEIIDPETGKVLPCGKAGEIVISTLRREAMPLLRYRTGDLGVMNDVSCLCGRPSPVLSTVLGRCSEIKKQPSIYELDELLYSDDTIEHYTVAYHNGIYAFAVSGNCTSAQSLISGEYPNLNYRILPEIPALSEQGNKRSLALDKKAAH